MSIDVKGNAPEYIKALRIGIEKNRKKVLSKIGAFCIQSINKRTLSGQSYSGGSFGKYSESYEKIRKKAGRPVSKIDLNFTGKMLAAMSAKVDTSATTSTIFFASNDADTKVKAWANERRFKFFGLTDNDIREITKIIDKDLFGQV